MARLPRELQEHDCDCIVGIDELFIGAMYTAIDWKDTMRTSSEAQFRGKSRSRLRAIPG
jgi:hypothetical protein